MNLVLCYCGSSKKFEDCCEPIIHGITKAKTAAELMRSRYVAYVIHDANYLMLTTHISQRAFYIKSEILHWATTNKWLKLEIIKSTENTVEFKAYFLDSYLKKQTHHELSTFIYEDEKWFYKDGIFF